MPIFDNILVTGNQTIQQDLQVNGNQTIQQSLEVNGNQTIQQSLQVNGSESIANHLGVGGTVSAGDNILAANRLESSAQATFPVVAPSVQQVRFFATSVPNQPGLVLKGTDGFDYVLFIDTTGGTPNIGIQRV